MIDNAAALTAPLPNGLTPKIAEDKFLFLRLNQIAEDYTNPRKRFDEGKLEELAQSIRAHGVIEPVIVRPNPLSYPGCPGGVIPYVLVCGARRVRAARLGGLASVAAIVREMSDKDVLEVMCVENANREDVHPLEEGDAFLRLVKDHGSNVHELADKIGKSERYVQRRLKLATLIPEAKDVYFEGRLSLEHFNILARIEPSQQKKALRLAWRPDYSKGHGPNYPPDLERPLTAREFEEQIRKEFFLALKSAPWDKTDAALFKAAGACATCTKRTGASPLLFDDADRTDYCLDGACFGTKRERHLQQVERAAKKSGEQLVRVATTYVSDVEQDKLACLANHDFRKVGKSDRCPSTQRALVVRGDNAGAQLDICANKKCKQHMGKVGGASTHGMSAEKQRAATEAQKQQAIAAAVSEDLVKGILANVPAKLSRREWLIIGRELSSAGHLGDVAKLLGMKDLPHTGWRAEQNAFIARLQASSEGDVAKALIGMCLLSLRDNTVDEVDEGLALTAAQYGLDAKTIEKEARLRLGKEELDAKVQRTAGAGPARGKRVRETQRAAANDDTEHDDAG